MFESITGNFETIFNKMRGRGRLSEQNIKDGLREVRVALLEAENGTNNASNDTKRLK